MTAPRLPASRGPLSAAVVDRLRQPAGRWSALPPVHDDPLCGDDFHLALYILYELHYRGFAGVDERWEWEPSLLSTRRTLEAAFEDAVRGRIGAVPLTSVDMGDQLAPMLVGDGPSLSGYLETHGTAEQMAEFAMHRSAYQLKEADPHTWAIPRLTGGPKSAMVEIQADEYGGGRPGQSHAELFAHTMAGLGLDPSYGAYLDVLPGTTLATVNLVTLFGLHRRLRGALVGHLAAFEMTSTGPMARYSRALHRFGCGPDVRRFYDVHVEADVRHADIAASAMAGALARAEPQLAESILFGAAALMDVEARFARHLLESWAGGATSLLERAAWSSTA